MDINAKNVDAAEQGDAKKQADEKAAAEAMRKVLHSTVRRGEITLNTPIRAKSKDVTALQYDFTQITALEYVKIMDSDKEASNVFKVTQTQALRLFAKAASKVMEDVDEIDILQRVGIEDVPGLVQTATLFVNTSSPAADKPA